MQFEEKLETINGLMLQTRACLNEEAVNEYAEIYRQDPNGLPPLETIWSEEDQIHYLVNGYHRFEAAKRAGLEKIKISEYGGNYRDAVKAALSANKDQLGVRRTNADKRAALALAWANRAQLFDHEPTERELADICGVSNSTAHEFVHTTRLLESSKRSGEGASGSAVPTCGGGASASAVPAVKHVGKAIAITDPATHKVLEHRDAYGRLIPERLWPAFVPGKINQAIQLGRKCHAMIKTAHEEGDYAFCKFPQLRLIALGQLISELNADKIHAVCPVCGGTARKADGSSCGWCHGAGVVTRYEYKQIPRDLHLPIEVTADNNSKTESNSSSSCSSTSDTTCTSSVELDEEVC